MAQWPSDKTHRQAWATLLGLAIVWGSSYILIKKSLLGFDAWQVGCLRMTLAAVAFLPIAIRHCRGLTWERWGLLTLVGLFGTGFPSFLFPLAQRELSSSLAAALSSLTPLMTMLMASLVFGFVLRGRRVLGILVGLMGALVLVAARYGFGVSPSDPATDWPIMAIGLAVAATLSYAISSNTVKRFLTSVSPLQVSAGAMMPLGIIGTAGLVWGGGLPIEALPGDLFTAQDLLVAYLAVSFLGLVGTALASWLFFRLIQLTDPVFASTVSYLVPGIALIWGLLDGEIITLPIIAGLSLILLGVYLAKN